MRNVGPGASRPDPLTLPAGWSLPGRAPKKGIIRRFLPEVYFLSESYITQADSARQYLFSLTCVRSRHPFHPMRFLYLALFTPRPRRLGRIGLRLDVQQRPILYPELRPTRVVRLVWQDYS